MCMVEYAEQCEFVNRMVRTCRKPTKCSECDRAISVGERYEYAFGKSDGETFVNRCCSHCMEARGWLQRECNGWCYSGVSEDLVEHWYEDNIHTMELGRLVVGIRKKWTKKNGQLMPLPIVAAKIIPMQTAGS